jgi:hypothetical protein
MRDYPQKTSVALALRVKSKSQQKFPIKGVIINVYARRMLYKHLLLPYSLYLVWRKKRSINKAFPSHALYYVKRQYRVVYGLVEALIAFLPLAY